MNVPVRAPNGGNPSPGQAFMAMLPGFQGAKFSAAGPGQHANDSIPDAARAGAADQEPGCLTWSYKDILEAVRRQQIRT